MGAAAVLNKQQEHTLLHQGNYFLIILVGNDNTEKKLNENIRNAHKLQMEKRDNNEVSAGKLKSIQKPSQLLKGPKTQAVHSHSPAPHLGQEPAHPDQFDSNGTSLEDLKSQHEKLVDLILNEEDELIASHHKYIENTISSGNLFLFYLLVKEQEKIRYDVNLPGSDVEEYIINLNQLLTQQQNDIDNLKFMIGKFHQHIKQEQSLSQKFYAMQEEQAEFNQDFSDEEY